MYQSVIKKDVLIVRDLEAVGSINLALSQTLKLGVQGPVVFDKQGLHLDQSGLSTEAVGLHTVESL
jgi:hypothetical protein